MKMTLVRKLAVIALFGLFSQFSMAQNPAVFGASINHFPTDADKAALVEISNNGSLPQGIRMMASVVSEISHSPSDQGKELMASIQTAGQAPE